MINKSFKKYLLGISQEESGALLIASLLMMVLLTIVGGAALTNSVIETKISANYKKSSSAFYIADAGIEDAKASLLGADINDILDGADDALAPPAAEDVDNGKLFTNKPIAGGSYTVIVTDDEGWVDTDTKVILTSTGTTPSGSSTQVIETIVQVDSFPFPGAISFVGTTGSSDRVRIELCGATGNGSSSCNVTGAVLSGLDTLDGSTTPGSGSCANKDGIATQDPTFNEESMSMANGANWGINEGTQTVCAPGGCPNTILSGANGSSTNAGGPTQAETIAMIAEFEADKDNNIVASTVSGSGAVDWGTNVSPKITVIQGGYKIDQDVTGYGVLIVKGKLEFTGGVGDFDWHGLIYVIDDGEIIMNDDTSDDMNVWGGIVVVDSGGGGEERYRLDEGSMHVYYSCQAIQNYVPGGGFQTIAWREIDT